MSAKKNQCEQVYRVICIILLKIKQEHNSNKSQCPRFTLLSNVISGIFVLITVGVEEGVGKQRKR